MVVDGISFIQNDLNVTINTPDISQNLHNLENKVELHTWNQRKMLTK